MRFMVETKSDISTQKNNTKLNMQNNSIQEFGEVKTLALGKWNVNAQLLMFGTDLYLIM